MALFCSAAPAGQAPVSYGRQIAPLFALYCTGCHALSNPSGGFRVTRFAGLQTGGNMGDDIVPGHPEKSILMEFIEGSRGPRQRMPQDSRPLTAFQIALIRRWIKEGAKNDGAESPCFELRIPNVPLSSSRPLEISARIAAPAFLTLSLSRTLYQEEASVNSPKERANIAAPGEWIRWRLIREPDWPPSVDVALKIQYATGPLDGSVLTAGEQRAHELVSMSCPPL